MNLTQWFWSFGVNKVPYHWQYNAIDMLYDITFSNALLASKVQPLISLGGHTWYHSMWNAVYQAIFLVCYSLVLNLCIIIIETLEVCWTWRSYFTLGHFSCGGTGRIWIGSRCFRCTAAEAPVKCQSDETFLTATKHLYKWFRQSVRLLHRLLQLFHYVPSSWNFQEILPMGEVMSMQKVKVTEVTDCNSSLNWNDTQSLMLLRRGALLFFKVIRQISWSHRTKIANFHPNWEFPNCNSNLNWPMATKWCTTIEVA